VGDLANGSDGRACKPLAYFDQVLEDFDAGRSGRHAHLGHWDDPTEIPETGEDIARAQQRMVDILLGLLRTADGDCVADIGCGLGGSLEVLVNRVRGLRAIGINVDVRQLNRCRSLVVPPGSTISWVLADAVRLPLGSQILDRVLCIEAVPHFASRLSFFAEVARCTKPGGVLVISDLQVNEANARKHGLDVTGLAQRLHCELGPWPEPVVELSQVVSMAAAAGFSCTESIDATHQTVPSHTLSFSGPDDEEATPSKRQLLRAERLLSWLHARAIVECHYLAFEKHW